MNTSSVKNLRTEDRKDEKPRDASLGKLSSTTSTLNLPLAEMTAANEETDQFYIVYPEQEQK